ncbi:MAG: CvpA family protein [Bacteroidota bacterium]|nr:CvpA family protein [Bacteroidota bacterium]
METIDLILLILLAWGAIRGFISGLIVQILSLVALMLGIWLGSEFAWLASGYLSKWLSINARLLNTVSFVLIFIGVLLGINLLARLITMSLKDTVAGRLNRIGGVLFGIVRMAFIASVCIVIINKIDPNHKLITNEKAEASVLYNPVSWVAPAIFPHLHFEEVKNELITK